MRWRDARVGVAAPLGGGGPAPALLGARRCSIAVAGTGLTEGA